MRMFLFSCINGRVLAVQVERIFLAGRLKTVKEVLLLSVFRVFHLRFPRSTTCLRAHWR